MPPFWAATRDAALAEVASSSAGLSSEEALARLRRVGPNEPGPPRRFEALRALAAYLVNPLVLILVAAGAASAVFGQVASSLIIVIRTAGRPWASRPSAGLAGGVCACAAAGAVLPFTPLASWLGFTPLPPLFFAILVLMVVTYLALVEVVKRWFYRRYAT